MKMDEDIKIVLLFSVVLLLVFAAAFFSKSVKGPAEEGGFLDGIVLEIDEESILVETYDRTTWEELPEVIIVSKEVSNVAGVPDLVVGEEVRVLYKEILEEEGATARIDNPITIYKLSELKEQ
ncbi:MAG: hypothetical protein GXZ08_10230 [Tissierellia bacterium]|nr:hypothetical protein [Tissierellia bacterium]